MYGKLFASMYRGTLGENWQALVTFQQMIILCDADGTIDITPTALSRETGIPIDIIESGISVLESDDPLSRTPDENGVRIRRLDSHRNWGWHIVNHEKYKILQDYQHVLDKNAARQQRFRDKQKAERERNVTVTDRNVTVTPRNARSRHTDTDTDTVRVSSKKKIPRSATPNTRPKLSDAHEVLQFLNEKTGKAFQTRLPNKKPTKNARFIIELIKKGYTVQNLKSVVARKHREWKDDKKMKNYLRPQTLFNATNFDTYYGECV